MFRERLTLNGLDVNRDITLEVGCCRKPYRVSSGPSMARGSAQSRAPYAPRVLRPAMRPSWNWSASGGQIRAAAQAYHVSPVYPPDALAGSVRMDAVIDITCP